MQRWLQLLRAKALQRETGLTLTCLLARCVALQRAVTGERPGHRQNERRVRVWIAAGLCWWLSIVRA